MKRIEITKANYFDKIENSIGVNTLPETLRKSHELVIRVTENGKDWSKYESNSTIKRIIDLYFEKLSEFTGRTDSSPAPKAKPEMKAKTEKPKTERRIKEKKKKEPQRSREKPKPKTFEKKKRVKLVESLKEEVKIIRRFVGLHNRVKTKDDVLRIFKALERAITLKIITKKSKFVKEIRLVQDKLIKLHSTVDGKRPIQINEKELARLTAIAGGEGIYPSIGIIKAYIGIEGKQIEAQKRDTLINRIERAFKSKKVDHDDPYADVVKKIYVHLKSYKPKEYLKISKVDLNGLEGIIEACDCCKKELGRIYKIKKKLRRCDDNESYSDAKKGACSYHKGLDGVAEEVTNDAPMNSMDFVKMKFHGLGFKDKWFDFIGDPSTGFTAMVYGKPKFGKSYLCVDFAGYLARNHGKVLYVAKEEGLDATLHMKLTEKSVAHPNLYVFGKMPDDLSPYQFVFLDSVTKLGLSPEDLGELEKKYPSVSFIYIFQVTKGGLVRGRNDYQHDVDVVIEVPEKGVAIQNGRFNQGGEMKIFPDERNENDRIGQDQERRGNLNIDAES